MSAIQAQSGIGDTFTAAERAGLKLAIKGRLLTILVVGVWLVLSRGVDRMPDIAAGVAVLMALGLLHFRVIGSPWDRKWVKYAFLTIDFALLSWAVATLPPEPGVALSQIFMFKFDIFYYYYLVLAVATFSFSPGLVLWSGFAGAAGWVSAFLWVRGTVVDPLEWGDVTASTSAEQFVSVFLNERFVGTGSRVQEALVFFVVALLIAVVMYRARKTMYRQIAAERDKAAISQIFGRFVPEVVAGAMIQDRGVLEPVERQATILFLDIAGFTALTESKGPRSTVDILNAFFDTVTEIINKHQGVVTQFQGDAVLAVFNVPVENEAHRQCAYAAAREILEQVGGRTFAGQSLSVRIGLNTGPVVAGNVGGGGRQSYTVHGDAVNVAARLEALNKEYGTVLILAQSTAQMLSQEELKPIGSVTVKGHSTPLTLFCPADPGSDVQGAV